MRQDFKSKKNNKVVKIDKKDTLAKCLAITLLMTKEEYESLTPDAYKKLFGDWKLKELKCLYKMYEDGISSFGAEARLMRTNAEMVWR